MHLGASDSRSDSGARKRTRTDDTPAPLPCFDDLVNLNRSGALPKPSGPLPSLSQQDGDGVNLSADQLQLHNRHRTGGQAAAPSASAVAVAPAARDTAPTPAASAVFDFSYGAFDLELDDDGR